MILCNVLHWVTAFQSIVAQHRGRMTPASVPRLASRASLAPKKSPCASNPRMFNGVVIVNASAAKGRAFDGYAYCRVAIGRGATPLTDALLRRRAGTLMDEA